MINWLVASIACHAVALTDDGQIMNEEKTEYSHRGNNAPFVAVASLFLA